MAPDNQTSPPKEHWHKLRLLLRNPISLAGVALSLVSLGNVFLFSLIGLIADRPKPYIGILAYLIAPGFLICGLLVIVVGAWRERRRKVGEARLYPRIDFNDPGQRAAAMSFGASLLVFVML